MAQRIAVMISVDRKNPGDTERVAGVLRQQGVEVTEVLDDLGTITANHTDDKLDELTKVAGVKRVERQRTVKIPPPDSDLQ